MLRLFAALLMIGGLIGSAVAAELTVFAPASLTEVLREVGPVWAAKTGETVHFNFSTSPIMAKQVSQGAPANIFICADKEWMDWVQVRGLIVNETRRDILGNELVLVRPRDRGSNFKITSTLNLPALLGPEGRLAIGDPASVPAGIYGKQALIHLGLWDSVSKRLATTDSVRAALLLVDRGEAPLGVVYATEAALSANVEVAAIFPPDSYSPVIYPAAIVKIGDTPEARAFLAFLSGPEARPIFLRHGFTVLPKP